MQNFFRAPWPAATRVVRCGKRAAQIRFLLSWAKNYIHVIFALDNLFLTLSTAYIPVGVPLTRHDCKDAGGRECREHILEDLRRFENNCLLSES
jgi:hypothetical protein